MGKRISGRLTVVGAALLLAGCASTPPGPSWEARLTGDAIVLLGELHDNAEHHRQRADVLRRALAAGWRPAIAMEQFDRERQADIERARKEKPRDAQHVIDAASPAKGKPGGNWNWDYYRPLVALALEFDVPLIAANLSAADVSRVVREGYAAVFDADTRRRLRLAEPAPAPMQAAQEKEIDNGHCNALPAKMLPAMARGQMARDAVMADIVARVSELHERGAQGVVLIAGNGHVRRDIGVPYWLAAELRARSVAVAYLEKGDGSADRTAAYDAVVYTVPAPREDPCIAFRQRLKPKPSAAS